MFFFLGELNIVPPWRVKPFEAHQQLLETAWFYFCRIFVSYFLKGFEFLHEHSSHGDFSPAAVFHCVAGSTHDNTHHYINSVPIQKFFSRTCLLATPLWDQRVDTFDFKHEERDSGSQAFSDGAFGGPRGTVPICAENSVWHHRPHRAPTRIKNHRGGKIIYWNVEQEHSL